MSETAWYLVALLPLAGLAGAHTAIDRWLFAQPRPLPRPAVLVLAARWGFLTAVLVYAWLIDSRRVPYAEPGIWALFGAGCVLTVGLVAVLLGPRWLRKRRKRGKKGRRP
jgi:hypothetical protein